MATNTMDEAVNVRSLLGSPNFGMEQIQRLEEVLGEHTSEIRQELRTLEDELSEGDKSKVKALKAGVAAFLLGDHASARDILSRLSGEALPQYYLGHVLVSLGRFREAAEAYQRAEEAGHNQAMCKLLRAGALRASGDLESAEKLLAKAPDQASLAEYCFQKGCLASDRGDTFGAVEFFERAVDMDPTHSEALFWLAGENCLRGNDDEAIRLYEQSLSRPPLHLGALMNLGLLYEDHDNFAAAAFCFRKVLDIDPLHERARLYLRDIDAAHDMYYDEDSLKNQARLKQILEIPVTDFELSVRARNCLQKMGVENLGDLTRLSEQDLLSGKNFGETSLQEIKEMMESKGLRLGQSITKDRPRDYAFQNENLSPQQQALLARPVADLNLSVRARKCMSRLNITTVGELAGRTADELLESKNFGVTSLNEVRAKLTEIGLRLRNE